jgi:hypothetical protein
MRVISLIVKNRMQKSAPTNSSNLRENHKNGGKV